MMQLVSRSATAVTQAKPWVLLGKPGPSLLEALWPGINTMQKLAVSLVMVGILVGLARARFFLPDNPVPITFQTFGVLAMGGLLGWRWGLFSILVYYFLGMAGAPVFQGGGNGWHYLSATATAGYIIGFILAAGVVGFLAQRGWNRGRSLWPMLLGSLLVYLPGLLWLNYKDLGWPAEGQLFSQAMYPFIPGDLVKLMLASLAVGLGWKIADSRNARKDNTT
ncbi:MAG: biotin transporter BioY [SAR202 cluster bacterium]|nr:biotin transporter BioY [SAR202 cluster bacterium]